jgi:hypothetical protein
MRPSHPCRLLAPLALLAAPGAVGAQGAPAVGAECVRRAPRDAYTRVPVFVHAELADSADRAARNSVDLVAQQVAERVRALVWAAAAGDAPPADTATTLPPADTLLDARGLRGALRVVARRGGGGAPAWRVARGEGLDTLSADTAGAALLARALGAAVACREILILDDVMRGDSLAFDLRFARPVVEGAARVLRPVRVRNPLPAFSLAVPYETQAAAVPGSIALRYPGSAQRTGYEGVVILQFVVGADGRAEPRTIRDLWPPGRPRLVGGNLRAYDTFVAAARTAVAGASFTPATVAGCPVRQLVQQPLAWTLNR